MSTRENMLENTASRLPSQARNKKITLVVSIGLALVTGAILFGSAASQQSTPPAPTGSVMRVAAVGDIHGEEASSITAATAAEAAKADIILGLGDYQYPDGAMWEYNRYFDKDWGPNVPKMYPVLAPHHDQDWSDAVRSRVFKFEQALAAGTDHKGLRAVRIGLARGILRRKALIEVIVGLQNDIDVLGNQEVDPGFDASFLAVTAGRAGKVRLVPVGDRT